MRLLRSTNRFSQWHKGKWIPARVYPYQIRGRDGGKKRHNRLPPQEQMCYYACMKKRKRGGQPGNSNARKHGFYSPTLSPACPERCRRKEISLVWNAVNVKSIDPAVGVIRVKLEVALLRDPANRRLLEDAAKLLTLRYAKELKLDEFDRRQFRALILSAIEASLAEQSETGRAQPALQDESSLL